MYSPPLDPVGARSYARRFCEKTSDSSHSHRAGHLVGLLLRRGGGVSEVAGAVVRAAADPCDGGGAVGCAEAVERPRAALAAAAGGAVAAARRGDRWAAAKAGLAVDCARGGGGVVPGTGRDPVSRVVLPALRVLQE